MDNCHYPILSFEVGQLVEVRSFQQGYRGAWFRCKIKAISRRNRQLHYALEYVDFPDEKIKWTKVYQLPHNGKSKEVKRELMVRPSYPPMHNENKAPETISETVIFVNNHWKVGDLMDCWIDGCYWSGRVTKIVGGNKAGIKLMPIPAGEGLSYTVCLEDVRPSLDWSPQDGWALPVSQDGKLSRCCGLLIHPKDGDARATIVQENNRELTTRSENNKFLIAHTNGKAIGTSPKVNFNAKETSMAKEVMDDGQIKIHLVEETTDTGKRKRSCNNSCNVSKTVSDEEEAAPVRGRLGPALSMLPQNIDRLEEIRFSQKKFIPCDESSLDMDPETPEAALLHLTELLSKVKWLKGILKSGTPFSSSDAIKPNWKIVENRATTSSKS